METDKIIVYTNGVKINLSHYAKVLAAKYARGLDVPNSVRIFKEHLKKK